MGVDPGVGELDLRSGGTPRSWRAPRLRHKRPALLIRLMTAVVPGARASITHRGGQMAGRELLGTKGRLAATLGFDWRGKLTPYRNEQHENRD